MSDIQILMCCHKSYDIVPPLCQPIQCGAALVPLIDGTIADNGGDNISDKNRQYCELTAHYYAWKNVYADYYGFCHYRRFFSVDSSADIPYFAFGSRLDNKLLGDEQVWQSMILQHSIITPRSEDMGLSVKEHYCTSEYHYRQDLELFMKILYERAPELIQSAEEYLSQNRQYFCNMFIMDRKHFYEYCNILFPMLEHFDKEKVLHGDFQSDRTNGYLGEIFTGIYITFCRKQGVKIKELPRIDIGCSVKKRFLYMVLPPESKRRFLAKKILRKMRGQKHV